MSPKADRSFLCSRCGAITPEAVVGPDGRGEGACPECGLGFAVVATVTAVLTGAAEGREPPPPPSPQRTAHQRRQEDILRNRPFPVHGLDSRWSGSRWVGGWGTSGDHIEHITLAHGDPFDEAAPLVRVATWRPAPGRLPLIEADAAEDLAQYMWQDAGAPHELVRPTFTSDRATASWSEWTLSVDGRPATFRALAARSHWVALARTADGLITIEARHLAADDTGLVTIDDVEPYLVELPS